VTKRVRNVRCKNTDGGFRPRYIWTNFRFRLGRGRSFAALSFRGLIRRVRCENRDQASASAAIFLQRFGALFPHMPLCRFGSAENCKLPLRPR
jgi:hypothetical protein